MSLEISLLYIVVLILGTIVIENEYENIKRFLIRWFRAFTGRI
jgi:hypothetical protein